MVVAVSAVLFLVQAQPCEDFSCDSSVVEEIVAANDLDEPMVLSLSGGRINKIYFDGSLSNKKMTVLPESIGRLSHLKNLELPGNEITEIPSTISSCDSLSVIKMNNNALSVLPEELMSLQIREPYKSSGSYGSSTTTYYLDLSWNKLCLLTDTMDAWISSYSKSDWKTKQNCSTSVIFNKKAMADFNVGLSVMAVSGRPGQKIIRFDVAHNSHVKLMVFSANGRLVDTPVNRYMNASSYSFLWHTPKEISAGVYYVSFACGTMPVNNACAVIY
jgi:hypothetical protein